MKQGLFYEPLLSGLPHIPGLHQRSHSFSVNLYMSWQCYAGNPASSEITFLSNCSFLLVLFWKTGNQRFLIQINCVCITFVFNRIDKNVKLDSAIMQIFHQLGRVGLYVAMSMCPYVFDLNYFFLRPLIGPQIT